MKPALREKVVTFGHNNGLVGIVCSPAEPNPSLPASILINSGIIHRVGANRLYVMLARHFAAAGMTTLRFDLSGIGDSERSTGEVSLHASVRADIAAAADLLCGQGFDRVTVIGLCSGAFDAFDYALCDPRVAGAAMIDMPGSFRNWGHLMRYVGERMSQPSVWKNRAKRLLGLGGAVATVARQEPNQIDETAPSIGIRGGRSRERMEMELDALAARGVQLSFTFTGEVNASYNHESQFRELFPRSQADQTLQVELLPWCDHIFSTREARAYIMKSLRDWIVTRMEKR